MRRPLITRARLLWGLALLGLAIGALGAAASVQAPPAQARLTLSQLQALIQQARSKQQGMSAVIARLDARLSVIGDRLAALDQKITTVSAELAEQQAVYDRLHGELVTKKRELAAAEQRLAWQELVFQQRVVDTYKAGDVDYVALLLDANGFEDLVSRLRLIKDLVGRDNRLVGELSATRDLVAQEKADIAAKTLAQQRIREAVKRRHDELAALRAEQLAVAASTRAARGAKARALADVETDIRAWEAQEATLAAESQGLAGIIQGLQGDGDGLATGSMVRPTPGFVTSPFGWRIHPIFHVRKFHMGVDLNGHYGEPIHAADGGRVIYASWMTGYGNTIIIDHGRGISTLYAHQSRLLITSGPVSKGQVIGYVGSTGYSTGPHLHFEVRIHGNPVNPLGYIH